MEEQKILQYQKKISKSLSNKFKFDIWEADDIKQEIYFLILQAEPEFDRARGDEYTFYFNYVRNRLMNFKRDNYSTNKFKMGIADARTIELDLIENIDNYISKYKKIINDRVDSSFRADYLRYCEGVKLPHKRKVAILFHIEEIINRANKREEIVYGEE
jgi:hypothetical protein